MNSKNDNRQAWMRKVAPIVSAKIKRGEKVVVHGTRGTGPIETRSLRALARELGRSPSHVCRVMHGERVSRSLAAKLRERGIKPGGQGDGEEATNMALRRRLQPLCSHSESSGVTVDEYAAAHLRR